MRSLAEFADVLVGATPGKEGAAHRYVRVADITEAGIGANAGAEGPYPVKGLESQLRQGDVLVRAKGLSLAAGRIRDAQVGAFTTADVFVVRPDPAICLPDYLVALLRSPEVRAELMGGLQGTGLLRLTREALAHLQLPLPPLNLQSQVGAIAQASEAELQIIDELRKLRWQLHTELLRRALEKARAEDGHPRREKSTGPADASADGLPIHPEKQKAGTT